MHRLCVTQERARRVQKREHHQREAEVRNDHNIRPPEERYGGEGHAGDDPFAGERAGHRDISPDPAVEMPDADLHELIQQPDERLEEIDSDTKSHGAERRTGTKST
jgi:hypothetical protein